jgi:hypothetical protein
MNGINRCIEVIESSTTFTEGQIIEIVILNIGEQMFAGVQVAGVYLSSCHHVGHPGR